MVDGAGGYVLAVAITILVVLLILFLILLGLLGKVHNWLHIQKNSFCKRKPQDFVFSNAENRVLWAQQDDNVWNFPCYSPELVRASFRLGELSQYLRCVCRRHITDCSQWSPGMVCRKHFFNTRSVSTLFACSCRTVLQNMCGCCNCFAKKQHYVATALECTQSKTLCFSFASTRSIGHWQKDVRFKQKHPVELSFYEQHPDIQIHSGMYEICREILPAMRQLVRKTRPARLLFEGHSLGGALAVITACDIRHLFPDIPVLVVTFGQPRIGNLEFADHVFMSGIPLFRIFNTEDTIPTIPPLHVKFSCCLDEWYAHSKSLQPCMFTKAKASLTDNHCRAYEEFVYEDDAVLDHMEECNQRAWSEEDSSTWGETSTTSTTTIPTTRAIATTTTGATSSL